MPNMGPGIPGFEPPWVSAEKVSNAYPLEISRMLFSVKLSLVWRMKWLSAGVGDWNV